MKLNCILNVFCKPWPMGDLTAQHDGEQTAVDRPNYFETMEYRESSSPYQLESGSCKLIRALEYAGVHQLMTDEVGAVFQADKETGHRQGT